MDFLKLNKIVSNLAFKLEASAKYPKDLGSWGLEENKIEELRRHLSRLVVELKIYDLNEEEFPGLKGKNLVEIEINSDSKSSRKAIDVLKRLKAFPLEEHHVSNKKHDKQSGYEPGHYSDPQYEIPDGIHVEIPKDLFIIGFENDEGDETDYVPINQKSSYDETISEDIWPNNSETSQMLKEFVDDIERAVPVLLNNLKQDEWQNSTLKLILNEPFPEENNPVSTLKIKEVDSQSIIDWLKKELPKAWERFLNETEFKTEDANEFKRKRNEENKIDQFERDSN